MIAIEATLLNFEREPLLKPFGFKGGYISTVWHTVVGLRSSSGSTGIGLGTQSVLWSDANVFAQHTPAGGNTLMLMLTEYALAYLKGRSYKHPMDLIDELLAEVLNYGITVTKNDNLRATFALNALVAVDFALWLLYASEHGIEDLDVLLPQNYKEPLSQRHDKLVSVPLLSYNTDEAGIKALLDDGYFVLKAKLGAPGNQQEMLAKDKKRLAEIHAFLKQHSTPHTPNGHIPYYLDANGRYEDKETLLRLLDHADAIGALERIIVLEEPFPESLDVDVSDLPVCVAADESAHTDIDAIERIEMGYSAIALKPIAKTLSMTLKIARAAHKRGIPCFCADLTVNPLLVEWNKAIAARLHAFPGIQLPMVETNGHQNYKNWAQMKSYLPNPNASWVDSTKGVFSLTPSFYTSNENLFSHSPHYTALLEGIGQ